MDILSQITISEVILLFNLCFVLPTLAFLLLRLRKYEKQFGYLPEEGKKKKKKKKEEEVQAPAPVASTINPELYPYREIPFLSPSDRACLAALLEALGEGVQVFPKVALWETMESTDKDPGYRERLNGRSYDFLVCDEATGQQLTGIMYRPVKGPAIAKSDEMKKICSASGAHLVFIDQAEEYDAATLKGEPGITELGL